MIRPSSKLQDWVKSLIKVIAGLFVAIVGLGMWRSPHLDWQGFKETILSVGLGLVDEIARMIHDPFAWVGLIVMIIGVGIFVQGAQNIRSGGSKGKGGWW